MAPASVVDVGEDQFAGADGALIVRKEMEPLGELTISTHGRGPVVTGSVRVLADGPMGGVLRFDSPDIGVAGVGTGFPTQEAIFPARRRESGINTGAAIRNLGEDPMTVSCQLTQKGQVLGEVDLPLAGNGQTAQFIDELYPEANTGNFVGSVRCRAPEDALFAGVALEMDFRNQIFTTLPVVPVPPTRTQDYTQLHFPHFANGASITSDLVLVNVASDSIRPRHLFLRWRRASHCSPVSGGPGIGASGPERWIPDRSDGRRATGGTHDPDPWKGDSADRIGESHRQWSDRWIPAVCPLRDRGRRGRHQQGGPGRDLPRTAPGERHPHGHGPPAT